MSDVVTDAIESSTVAASTASAGRLDRLRRGLHRLLFRPVSAFPLAIVRIGVGFALVLWTTSMAFDVGDLLDHRDTAIGTVTHVRPPGEIDGSPARWDRGPAAAGTHAPTW